MNMKFRQWFHLKVLVLRIVLGFGNSQRGCSKPKIFLEHPVFYSDSVFLTYLFSLNYYSQEMRNVRYFWRDE